MALLCLMLTAACAPESNNAPANTNAAPAAETANANTPPTAQPAPSLTTIPPATAPAPPATTPTVPVPVPATVQPNNPATAAKPAEPPAAHVEGPKLVMVSQERDLDFGKQPQDKALVRPIRIKNGGTQTLNIESVSPS